MATINDVASGAGVGIGLVSRRPRPSIARATSTIGPG